MITEDTERIPIKFSHYVRYYENVHGIRLSPEQAEREAKAEGFLIDYSGDVAVEIGDITRNGAGVSKSRAA
jgi:hypothetical protein